MVYDNIDDSAKIKHSASDDKGIRVKKP